MQRQRLLAFALAAAGLLASTTPATAQAGGQTPSGTRADSGRRMFDPVGRLLERRNDLKITDEQATRLEEFRAKYLAKNQPRLEKLRRDREEHAAFRAGLDSNRTEVMAVLTPEQQKQVGEMRKEMRKKWRREHGRRHGGKHDDHDDDDDDDK